MAYGLAMLLFREAKYCVIVSDTEAQAVMFLQNIKTELLENNVISDLFGLYKNEKDQVQFDKDSEADIIVKFQDGHKFRIQAKGADKICYLESYSSRKKTYFWRKVCKICLQMEVQRQSIFCFLTFF